METNHSSGGDMNSTRIIDEEIARAIEKGDTKLVCHSYETYISQKDKELEELKAAYANQSNELTKLKSNDIAFRQNQELTEFVASCQSSQRPVVKNAFNQLPLQRNSQIFAPAQNSCSSNNVQQQTQNSKAQNSSSVMSGSSRQAFNPFNVRYGNYQKFLGSRETEVKAQDVSETENIQHQPGSVELLSYNDWLSKHNLKRNQTYRGHRGGNITKRKYFSNKYGNKQANATLANVASFHIALANQASKDQQQYKGKKRFNNK